VEAIFPDSDVPAKWAAYLQINANRVQALQQAGGHLTEKKEPKIGPVCKQ